MFCNANQFTQTHSTAFKTDTHNTSTLCCESATVDAQQCTSPAFDHLQSPLHHSHPFLSYGIEANYILPVTLLQIHRCVKSHCKNALLPNSGALFVAK